MKKIRAICLLLCILYVLCCHTAPVFATQLPETDTDSGDASVTSGCHGLDAHMPMLGSQKLVENAEAVVLYEWSSQTLLYAWNADAKMYPASFVKIMTALLAAEQGDMEEIVTVPEGVLDLLPSDASSSELKAGEEISMLDLMYCMMVDSANDAAVVIADHLMGSQSAFVAEMNRRAEELGCTGTNFTNVHGLHDDNQYTTARDSARILAAAMEHEVFRTVFGAESYTVPATNLSEERYMVTGNFLISRSSVDIYYDNRVTGGRTGVTNIGTRCLAASAESNGMRLISIVMGCVSTIADDGHSVQVFGSFPETRALLDAGFNGYKTVQLLYSGQTLRQYTPEKGECDVIVGTRESFSTVLPENVDISNLSYRYSDAGTGLQLPVEKGSPVSTVQIWHNNICVVQAQLYAMNSVEESASATLPEREPEEQPTKVPAALVIFLLAAVTFLVVVLILRFTVRMRRAIARSRSRRYRRDRRRSR